MKIFTTILKDKNDNQSFLNPTKISSSTSSFPQIKIPYIKTKKT